MSFKNLACVILLLPNASYVMAGSQLQLSSDVMVDQKMKNIVVQTSYFKNKIDNTKFIRISNHTRSFPLILSLPEIKYSVIIKNGHSTLLSEDDGMIWVEPGSNVILKIKEAEKLYDFIPIVYITGKKKPNVLTVLPGKAISAAKETKLIEYKVSPNQKRMSHDDKVVKLSGFGNINKLKKGFYEVQVDKFTSVSFDKEALIITRNNMLAGSQYYTKNLVAYPHEKIIMNISGETHVEKQSDVPCNNFTNSCQHPPGWHKTLPAINFSPVKTVEMPGKVTGEYSVRVVNAGIDVYIIIDNGYNEFMTVDKLSLYGNRCGYESQGELLIPPAAVSTYMVPNVALLGLCYTDDIKLIFINNTFNGLSKDKKDTTVPIEVMMQFKLTSAKEKEEFNDVIYSSWN